MFSPDPMYNAAAGFFVYVYPQNETKNYVGFFDSIGGSPTNGTAYAHNLTGSFYMSVQAGIPGILNYTLIVEQDLNSVPEFPPSTVLLLALTSTLLVAIALAYRKQRSKRVLVKTNGRTEASYPDTIYQSKKEVGEHAYA